MSYPMKYAECNPECMATSIFVASAARTAAQPSLAYFSEITTSNGTSNSNSVETK
ncbi:unnamed protein product [Strongylus vulgaris]|uniref:Uncharacterized protein n=1 Tax=Strongylus vulgaris TaxID=40348 RepID=A0A3P7ICN3_STRVU|nr:unnamed protein product [Strongylus vulgaris]